MLSSRKELVLTRVDHVKAWHTSHGLCDPLFDALAAKFPDLRTGWSHKRCGIYQVGPTRFAYINECKGGCRPVST